MYEVGTSEAGPYLVLEKIQGRSLREVLDAAPMPVRRILVLATQIAEGIAKAHSAGIVHRDLKPGTARWSRDGRRLFMWLRPVGGDDGSSKLYVRDGEGPWQAVTPALSAGPFVVSPDGREVATPDETGIYRRDLASGRVEPWRTIAPADPSVVIFVGQVLIADGERSFVNQYGRRQNDLDLARGLR